MKAARFTGIAILLVAPIFMSGCSLLGLGGPPPLCDDPAVKNYAQKVSDISSQTLQAAGRIGELLSRAQNDSSLIDDSIWKSTVNEQVQKIVAANQQIKNLSAPRKELGVFHQLLTGAFQNYADGIQMLQQGVNGKDLQKINNGVALLQQGDNKLNGAHDEEKSVLRTCSWFLSS